MSRITKYIALDVANQMTSKKKNEVIAAQGSLDKYIQDYAESRVPKDVMAFFKKHKDFVKTDSAIQFCGNGFNYESFRLLKSLPCTNHRVTPDDKIAKEVIVLMNTLQKKASELKQLKNEIQVALVNLGTYKKVELEFPEAFKLLPKRITQALTININSIREKL